MFDLISVKTAIQDVVKTEQERFADYVRRVKDRKSLTYRQIAQRAKDAGFDLSHATVADIVNKPEKGVTVRVIQALARGLGEPEGEVMSAAQGVLGDNGDFRESRMYLLYEAAKNAPEDLRQSIDTVVRVLLDEAHRRAQSSR